MSRFPSCCRTTAGGDTCLHKPALQPSLTEKGAALQENYSQVQAGEKGTVNLRNKMLTILKNAKQGKNWAWEFSEFQNWIQPSFCPSIQRERDNQGSMSLSLFLVLRRVSAFCQLLEAMLCQYSCL